MLELLKATIKSVVSFTLLVPKKVAILLIVLYRVTVSRIIGPCCAFEPSCSEYGLTAIKKHGVIRGSRLIMLRLLRCHPFVKKFRYDPVPPSVSDILRDDILRDDKKCNINNDEK